ncbi:MAG TPA: SBBP repeat-containing protein [Candidatus Sulfotelmatobacter sp.]|nr:SBBP repeat-containing protein [Candidatus Sulfotelmatobacter sp.]
MATAASADTAPGWSRVGTFSGSGDDSGNAVKIDKFGNRYVTGFFSSTANFNGSPLTSRGDTDVFLAKFAQDGSLLWLVQVGGLGHDESSDLAFDFQGNVYLTGWFTNSATFGSVNGAANTRTGRGETIFLAKYSTAGNLVWVRKGVTPNVHVNRGYSLAINPNTGSLFLTGVSQEATSFSSADNQVYSVPGPLFWHMFLVKYDLRGQFLWGEWNEASPNSIPHRVAIDSNDNAYVGGWFEASATFHSADGNNQTVTGLSGPVQTAPDYPGDSFLVKYDKNGNLQWINDVGGYKAIATDVAVAPDGTVSLTGFIGNINTGSLTQAQTIVTSQSPGSSINLGGGQFTNPYNRDVFLASYSGDGVLNNALRIGAESQDAGGGIAYDDFGNLYLSGVFQGMIDVGGQTLNGTQTNNVFVLKYTAGSLAWAVEADGAGTQNYEQAVRLATRAGSTKVFVTGAYAGTANFGNITLHSGGADDVFAMELK